LSRRSFFPAITTTGISLLGEDPGGTGVAASGTVTLAGAVAAVCVGVTLIAVAVVMIANVVIKEKMLATLLV
jgi:phage tail sheath gpL-like